MDFTDIEENYKKLTENSSLLQTLEWGKLKSKFGWNAFPLQVDNSAIQMLNKPLAFGYTLSYLPKVNIQSITPGLWKKIDDVNKQNRAVFLLIELDSWEDQKMEKNIQYGMDLQTGLLDSIQPRRTIVISISESEDEILKRMKQKTRYNIRLAEKKEIVVKSSNDIETFSKLMEKTGERDEFGVHTKEYYQEAYNLFQPQGKCELLLAYYNEIPVAGIMNFYHADYAYYLYGASSNEYRNRMPTYLLQWEGIKRAKEKGCKYYDLWGVPDYDQEELERDFNNRYDGLWGVYRFKRGFGGVLMRSEAPVVKVYNHFLFKVMKLIQDFRKR